MLCSEVLEVKILTYKSGGKQFNQAIENLLSIVITIELMVCFSKKSKRTRFKSIPRKESKGREKVEKW